MLSSAEDLCIMDIGNLRYADAAEYQRRVDQIW
jgi:hypothetical protein